MMHIVIYTMKKIRSPHRLSPTSFLAQLQQFFRPRTPLRQTCSSDKKHNNISINSTYTTFIK